MRPGAEALSDGVASFEDDWCLASREEVRGGRESNGTGADDGNR
jgi:hypothetical protein